MSQMNQMRLLVWGAFACFVVAGIVVDEWRQQCERRGGVLVTGVFKLVCVAPR